MPYIASNLIPLVAADSFTLWLYKTTDTRATVLSTGYFSAARTRLLAGHMVVLEAADATALLPVRTNAEVGNGLVVDASSSPLRLTGAGAMSLDADVAAAAVARCISLNALPSGVNEGETFTVRVTASGATSAVRFSILNASGAVVLGPSTAAVSSGSASVTFNAPAPGNGYLVKVEDAADSLVAQTSPSFVVLAAFALLVETGLGLLMAEAGTRLVM
ncbi:hypothetical protein [Roseomonas indoligenes]|uniref:Uncharacterized protein n=1 Tax=Roseomonas indoligenes TaxID=2820811 RepID=A0A940MV72_9PROT|nr:hypothetical protein [Pararoseomonas indoligenes]MBP0491837.1 hypothetical protein [Pararoseomonas indoligenes]